MHRLAPGKGRLGAQDEEQPNPATQKKRPHNNVILPELTPCNKGRST